MQESGRVEHAMKRRVSLIKQISSSENKANNLLEVGLVIFAKKVEQSTKRSERVGKYE